MVTEQLQNGAVQVLKISDIEPAVVGSVDRRSISLLIPSLKS
jgi:hypothetical protein